MSISFWAKDYRIVSFALLFFAIILQTLSPTKSKAYGNSPNILILSSYHAGYGGTDPMISGIKKAFSESEVRVNFYIEYLDTKRFDIAILNRDLKSLYKKKFSKKSFEVILVADNNAFDFILQIRDQVFPNVPIVFCGINNFDSSMIEDIPLITGVAEDISLNETVKLALSLHPETTHLAVLSDSTTTGAANLDKFKQVKPLIPQSIEVIELSNLTADELRIRLRKLPNQTILLQLSFYQDRAGQRFTQKEQMDFISSEVSIPIYSAWDFFITHGVLGGVVTYFPLQGEMAGQMALEIIKGTPTKDIPVVENSPNIPLFDFLMLERHKISLSSLPHDSVVLNVPQTFYTQNKVLFWSIVFFIIFQSLIIGALIRSNRRQRRTESLLLESEEKYRTVFEDAALGKTVNALDGRFLNVNQSLCDYLGYNREDLLGKKWQDVVQADFVGPVENRIQSLLIGKTQSFIYELKVKNKGGCELWLRNNVVLIHDGSGVPLYLFADVEDITSQKRNKALLQESEEKYRLLFDSAEIMFSIFDRDGCCLMMNKKLANFFGQPAKQLVGKNFYELHKEMGGEYTRRIQEVIDNDFVAEVEDLVSFPNGVKRWFATKVHPVKDANGVINAAQIVSLDITEKKNLIDHLQQTQKMEALGILAGGIAHDFNNLLSPILGFTELVKMRTAEDEKTQKSLDQVLVAGLRAKELVKHILAFSRKGEAKDDFMQIVPIVKEIVKFLKTTTSPDIKFKCVFPFEDLTIFADPTQVHQVLMNLLTNAIHAMREYGGVIEITVDTVEIDDKNNLYSPDLDIEKYVMVEIKDTGHGISQEIIDRIFEPFFTTKPRGQGTGLGLSQAYGLVKDMGGHISVASAKDTGSTFTLLIPYQDNTVAVLDDSLKRGLVKGEGRIIIVDDETSILDWTSNILTECGYTTVAATNGMDALKEFKRDADSFDLILTDLSMPTMTGVELAKSISEVRPDIPILLVTGFGQTLSAAELKDNGIDNVLLKPLIASELSQSVDFHITHTYQA